MEKLTLEHVSYYAPHNTKVKTGNVIKDLVFEPEYNITHTTVKNVVTGLGHKLILRAMDLTKPITVDGQEIIPIVELCKIASNVLEFNEDSVKYNEEQRQLEVTGKRGYKLIFAFDEKDSSFILMSNSKSATVSNQLALFQWLAKHKFDFMNLIPEKLAIDVNTLDVNPYN